MTLLFILFAAVHSVYYLAGLRFDTEPLGVSWQFIDPELLRHRLLESVYYLHSQPPLFNLFLGAVLKLAPNAYGLVFQAIFVTCGFILYVVVTRLMEALSVPSRLALILSTWFMASPSFVLYEHWLFYTFPVSTILATSTYFFHRSLRVPTATSLGAFFGLLFALCATRGMFHLLYFVVAAAMILVAVPRVRARHLAIAATSFALLFGLYVKSYVLFGKFSLSTWMGMSLAKVVTWNIPDSKRRQLVDQGVLSPLALITPFSRLEAYTDMQTAGDARDVRVLRDASKSNGEPNYNHIAYIRLSDQYMVDVRVSLEQYPRAAALGLAKTWFLYFRSTSDYRFVRDSLDLLKWPRRVNELYDVLFYGKVTLPAHWLRSQRPRREQSAYVWLVVMLSVVFLYALSTLMSGVAAGRRLPQNNRWLLLYIAFNVIFVAVIGNTFELGENQRFRFSTDPLSVVLLGFFLKNVVWDRLVGRTQTQPPLLP